MIWCVMQQDSLLTCVAAAAWVLLKKIAPFFTYTLCRHTDANTVVSVDVDPG